MRKPLVLSFSLHSALFALLFVHFNFAQNQIGRHEKINAYMYQQQSLANTQVRSPQYGALPINENSKISSAKPPKTMPNYVNQPARQMLGKPDELLMLLHNLIEAQINRTSFFNQEQKVVVTFTLFPDGHIENAALLGVSESASLNAAIINAVNAIAPVKIAHNFLSNPRMFKIQIVFSARG